eukprot:Skav234084  [mRNA]  locus=scaffold212:52296:55057:- [translate_table: standard]
MTNALRDFFLATLGCMATGLLLCPAFILAEVDQYWSWPTEQMDSRTHVYTGTWHDHFGHLWYWSGKCITESRDQCIGWCGHFCILATSFGEQWHVHRLGSPRKERCGRGG